MKNQISIQKEHSKWRQRLYPDGNAHRHRLDRMMATFVGINVMNRFDESKVETTKIQIKQLGVVLEDFRRVCGFYPTTDQGLDALVKKAGRGRPMPKLRSGRIP